MDPEIDSRDPDSIVSLNNYDNTIFSFISAGILFTYALPDDRTVVRFNLIFRTSS